jgi:exodeoxyribonuclease VII small subunit
MSAKASRDQTDAGAHDSAPAESGPADPAANYELARDELARVVAKLEAGGLGLEESLTLWERGESLAKQCTAFLDGARERVDAALAEAQDPDDD